MFFYMDLRKNFYLIMFIINSLCEELFVIYLQVNLFILKLF